MENSETTEEQKLALVQANREAGLIALAKLREPFPDNEISKLPKPTRAQSQCDVGQKIRCQICGGFHHPKVIHLDYVGHAALTKRLLDVDLAWNWEPLTYDDGGLPTFDSTGGLWIKLTVCGMTRLGYGHAPIKEGPGDRMKEVIGDALRNAAMRFGAALDLWHKGEFVNNGDEPKTSGTKTSLPPYDFEKNKETLKGFIENGRDIETLIASIQSKATLTIEQINEVRTWKKQ